MGVALPSHAMGRTRGVPMMCSVGLFLLASALAPAANDTPVLDATTTINVLVTDRRGNPLPSAQVVVNGSEHKGVTNKSGRVVFTNIKTGSYTLRVERQQYITFEKDFAVDDHGGSIPVVAAISPLASLPARPSRTSTSARPAASGPSRTTKQPAPRR
jgi:hypothetical protein